MRILIICVFLLFPTSEQCNKNSGTASTSVSGMYHEGISDPAVLITGSYVDSASQSAEIYHPARDSACVLPDLPDERNFHTQDGSLLCGGLRTLGSCLRWNPEMGSWDNVTESLTENRVGHISWTPAGGSVTYLMGGARSKKTSEVISQDDGVSASSFPLQHDTW